MPRSLRPLVLLAVALPSVYGLVSACSLDLDESLISGTGGDASLADAQSLGGFEAGGGWSDAKSDAPSNDDSGGSDATPDSLGDVADTGPVSAQIDCGTEACDLGSVCCWENGVGLCAGGPAQCPAAVIACDATDDCASGDVCCVLDIAGSVGCATSCPDTLVGMIQFCDASSECQNGMCEAPPALIANMLPPGYKACQ